MRNSLKEILLGAGATKLLKYLTRNILICDTSCEKEFRTYADSVAPDQSDQADLRASLSIDKSIGR